MVEWGSVMTVFWFLEETLLAISFIVEDNPFHHKLSLISGITLYYLEIKLET